jgi:REP-associated tyrosine transposase
VGRYPARFADVEIDAFVVMPNHLHGVVVLPDRKAVGTEQAVTRSAPTIGQVVGAFKSAVTVAYIRGVKSASWPPFRQRLWQRNYYEHVIRNEADLNRVRRYIDENPARWAFDDENPLKIRSM